MKITNLKNDEMLFLDNSQINQIHIFNNGEILGYFDNYKMQTLKNEKIAEKFDDLQGFTLATPIKKAIKVNLQKTNSFYIKSGKDNILNTPKYNVYIHISDIVKFSNLGNILSMETKHEKNYLQAYEITFYKVEIKEYKIEFLPDNKNFIPADFGGIWSECYGTKEKPCFKYSNHRKQIIKKWYEYNTHKNYTVVFARRGYTKTIKDDFLINCVKITEDINEKNIFFRPISCYEIERLLNYFDITMKEGFNYDV